MNQETKIRKYTIECYKIRPGGGVWANISLDAWKRSWRISIASDFGSWEHYWGSGGEEFKDFLCGLDIHYVSGKFGENSWFDQEATMLELRKLVAEHDNAKEKKAMANELDELEKCMEVNAFCHIALNKDTLYKLWDTGPNIHTGISPSFRRFWDEIWPIFIAELKKELQADPSDEITSYFRGATPCKRPMGESVKKSNRGDCFWENETKEWGGPYSLDENGLQDPLSLFGL